MEEKQTSSNFIKNIVVEDLETGKHQEIITRFPPEPNGYLHIGHAKSIVLNFELADEFKGKTNLRFDDTNPVKEDTEYVESIKEDVKWLGFNWDNLLFASDYFEEMYNRAVLLIKKGKAFVCDMTPEEIKEYRGTLKQSTSRIASSMDVAPTAANSAVRIGSSHERGTNDGAARL
jgi:glutaminyl-tRNA synthetase